jgi:hypothetical protein
MQRFCDEDGIYIQGLFFDACFASVRRTEGSFPMHSGGQDGVVRTRFRYVICRFRCWQMNVLVALTDIGPGDGGTRVLPGSHKSNLPHPVLARPYNERAKILSPTPQRKLSDAISKHKVTG